MVSKVRGCFLECESGHVCVCVCLRAHVCVCICSLFLCARCQNRFKSRGGGDAVTAAHASFCKGSYCELDLVVNAEEGLIKETCKLFVREMSNGEGGRSSIAI